MPDNERLVRLLAFLLEQIVEGGKRLAVSKTQTLRVLCPLVDGEAVEVGIVVGMVIEVCLQSAVFAQLII